MPVKPREVRPRETGGAGPLKLAGVASVFVAAASLEGASPDVLPYFAAGAAVLLIGLLRARLRARRSA